MDGTDPELKRAASPSPDEIIVRADEVDEEGVDISEIASESDQDLEARVEARRQQEIQGSGSPRALANEPPGTIRSPTGPILRRDNSAPPPPPRQPPPPAPPAQPEENQPADSLSLGQLRNIVAQFPKLEPTAYAYTHEDTRSFPEELEEWFQYTEEDRGQLARAKESFEESYNAIVLEGSSNGSGPWLQLATKQKEEFVANILKELKAHGDSPLPFLDCLSYLAMGVWSETTREEIAISEDEAKEYDPPNTKFRKTGAQLECIKESANLLCDTQALQNLYGLLKDLIDPERAVPDGQAGERLRQQVNASLTTIYFIVESGREQLRKSNNDKIRRAFVALKPDILQFLSRCLAALRWDDESNLPFTRIMLLLWKSTLLIFGGTKELANCKKNFRNEPDTDDENEKTILTATPIDYHAFRQELTSKYPAYNPPPPLVPLEAHNNSILPPHSGDVSRNTSHENLQALNDPNGTNKSIFHQPVHIATPAPSPPPSPGGPGGKGGKKQNYQTNQMFPFLYPPLDSSSNDLGGKGKAGEQSRLVGKKWEGSDVPRSIIEAGELFASRMRMSRPMSQIWDVREEYIREERGWKIGDDLADAEKKLAQTLSELKLEEDEPMLNGTVPESPGERETRTNPRKKETDDDDVQARLDAVETFFRGTFPHFQSVIIVLLKVLLSNVTVLGSMNGTTIGGWDGYNPGPAAEELPKSNINLCRNLTTSSNRPEDPASTGKSLAEVNTIRTREVTSKAISAFILLILKWFRFSHALKFHYTTQLLLDSNYLPLALKYFALQDVDKAVDLKNDREDMDFFRFCRLAAGLPSTPVSPTSPKRPSSLSSSDDEAMPPPIARHRQTNSNESPPPSPGSPPSPSRRPEVDELGYPTTALPTTPLTTYAPRFFHTFITTLRILQKLSKNHAHRALLLVQYKSSTILRKALKLPQPQVRLYTLKLFKTQVPFCGRKWRQANMRVITAIYVFCRMGLRDEWISGGGAVEEWVENAVATEKQWRSLVGFWLGKEYKNVVIKNGDADSDMEPDFFFRELDKMGYHVDMGAMEDDDAAWEGEVEHAGLQLEGW